MLRVMIIRVIFMAIITSSEQKFIIILESARALG